MTESDQRNPPVLNSMERMADTPRSIDPPVRSGSRRKQKLKKSTYYGILLYIMSEFSRDISPEQRAWIVYYSRKLSIAELLKASTFQSKLATEETTLKRTQHEINRIRTRIPRLENLSLPEPNRIGIGYRDKGALRPLTKKREIGEDSFWSDDVRSVFPQLPESEGKWITANEVNSLTGDTIFELLKLAHRRLINPNGD